MMICFVVLMLLPFLLPTLLLPSAMAFPVYGGRPVECECKALWLKFDINCSDTLQIAAAYETLIDDPICEYYLGRLTCKPIPACERAFSILKTHHDHCPAQTLTNEQAFVMHVFRRNGECQDCWIRKKYDPDLPLCTQWPICNNYVGKDLLFDAIDALNKNGCAEMARCSSVFECRNAFQLLRAAHDYCYPETLLSDVRIVRALHEYETSCKAAECTMQWDSYTPAPACRSTTVTAPPPSVTVAKSNSDCIRSSVILLAIAIFSAH